MDKGIKQGSSSVLDTIKQLKKLRKKIKKLTVKKEKKILSARQQKFIYYKPIDTETKKVLGGKTTTLEITQKDKEYFKNQELKDLSKLNIEKRNGHKYASGNNPQQNIFEVQIQRIPSFWKTVLLSCQYGDFLTQFDYVLLECVTNLLIDQNQIKSAAPSKKQDRESTRKQIVLEIEIGSNTLSIEPGIYLRKLDLDQKGQPLKFGGNSIGLNNIRKLKKGLLKLIFTNSNERQNLMFLKQFLEVMREQMIPYALEYFLKGRSSKKSTEKEEIVDQEEVHEFNAGVEQWPIKKQMERTCN